MFRRTRKRVKMVLGVRAVGHDQHGTCFDELTYTLDLAVDGVRLGGMEKVALHRGDVIEIRRRANRALFRVMWVGEPGTPRTGHVGLKSLDASPDFWGVDMSTESEVAFPLPFGVRTSEQHTG